MFRSNHPSGYYQISYHFSNYVDGQFDFAPFDSKHKLFARRYLENRKHFFLHEIDFFRMKKNCYDLRVTFTDYPMSNQEILERHNNNCILTNNFNKIIHAATDEECYIINQKMLDPSLFIGVFHCQTTKYYNRTCHFRRRGPLWHKPHKQTITGINYRFNIDQKFNLNRWNKFIA